MDCYRCGQEGHARSECPDRWPVPAAALASPAAQNGEMTPPPSRLLIRVDPAPPTPAYLQERQRLGMPSGSGALNAACPWCGAGSFSPCKNCGTGQRTGTHHARMLACLPRYCLVAASF